MSTTATAPIPDLFTVAEVAKLLRVSKMTVYRMVEKKQIEYVEVGERNFRITRRGLEAYLTANTHGTPKGSNGQ